MLRTAPCVRRWCRMAERPAAGTNLSGPSNTKSGGIYRVRLIAARRTLFLRTARLEPCHARRPHSLLDCWPKSSSRSTSTGAPELN